MYKSANPTENSIVQKNEERRHQTDIQTHKAIITDNAIARKEPKRPKTKQVNKTQW